MNVTKKQTGSELLVELEGSIDSTTSNELNTALNESLNGVNSMILDFKRLTGVMIKSIILPILGIIIGAFCISGDFLVPDALIQYTGILLSVYSIIDIVSILLFTKEEKKIKKTPKIQEGEIVKEKSRKI